MKKIFNRQIALQLRDMGNPLFDAIPNNRYVGLVVYVFKHTKKLERDLTTILTSGNY